uniref:EOG090X06Q3 n=1 Tax=Daphnia similis TaxID=35528 RepID=A0A4Y7N4W3_9CRUS|nr:EOG090X06Q3 [Daphnia similis]SVE87393.1 EOG090X06Q3 [Daphnia similis]SVE88019.1 EOG090X06Q3 [Daphnia similis]
MAALKTIHRNVPYLKQQLSALLGNTSSSVKIVCLVVLIGYFISYHEPAVRFLTVTPGYVFPPGFRIWTIFTHCFIEFHFWEVCVDVVTLGLCGKLIEPLWGKMEMLTFFTLINTSVAFFGIFFYLAIYMATFNTDVLFEVHLHGLSGYIAAVSVAVKQMMPDHVVIKTPLGKMTNRNVPLCVSLLSIILYVVGLLEGAYPTMYTTGVVIGWLYLRFYQRHSNGTRGDMADNFTFASFFPTVMQPPIEICSKFVYNLLVGLRICRKPVRKYDVGGPTAITISLPGTDTHDAERRRQIALKALSERLSQQADSTASWPSLEEDSRPKTGMQAEQVSQVTNPVETLTVAGNLGAEEDTGQRGSLTPGISIDVQWEGVHHHRRGSQDNVDRHRSCQGLRPKTVWTHTITEEDYGQRGSSLEPQDRRPGGPTSSLKRTTDN